MGSASTTTTTPNFVNETTFYSNVVDNDQYLIPFQWEVFDISSSRRWMGRNWHYSCYVSLFYVSAVFTGQAFMKKRDAFSLRGPLFYWNLMLATFSIIGFLRSVPEIHYIMSNRGFQASVCELKDHNSAMAFWGWLMVLSKLVELGDTAFIVLHKQPLQFLHCTYELYDSSKRWFVTMNYFTHSLMYSYYAAKAMKIKIPRKFAMVITMVQLTQMFVGIFIELYSLYLISNHGTCTDRSLPALYLGLGMFASFYLLFANFFLKSYCNRKTSGKDKTK